MTILGIGSLGNCQFAPADEGFVGTWFLERSGSEECHIKRDGDGFKITNEAGYSAHGTVSGRNVLTIWDWQIDGFLSDDRNRINWTNRDSWIRKK